MEDEEILKLFCKKFVQYAENYREKFFTRERFDELARLVIERNKAIGTLIINKFGNPPNFQKLFSSLFDAEFVIMVSELRGIKRYSVNEEKLK